MIPLSLFVLQGRVHRVMQKSRSFDRLRIILRDERKRAGDPTNAGGFRGFARPRHVRIPDDGRHPLQYTVIRTAFVDECLERDPALRVARRVVGAWCVEADPLEPTRFGDDVTRAYENERSV